MNHDTTPRPCVLAAGPSGPGDRLYRGLLGFDCLLAAIVGCFLLVGLGDGSVSAGNAGAWILVVAAFAGVVGGAVALRRAANTAAASALLMLLAAPALLYLLLVVMAVLLGARWN